MGLTTTSSCQVTYTPSANPGTHTITGTYGGSSAHSASPGNFNLTVTKRTTSTTVNCSPSSVAFGQASTCTAVVADTSSGTASFPTGTVTLSATPAASGTFSSTTCSLTQVGATTTSSCNVTYTPSANAGPHTINASYSGSTTHAVSSDPDGFVLTVTKRSTTTSVACPASLALHETGSCTATVTDSDSGDKSAPGGSVAFTLDASSIAGATGTFPGGASCTLAPAGPDSSSCSVNYRPATTEGSHVIKGAYGGSALHDTSSGTDSINVTKRSTTTSVACPASLALHETGSCTATVTDSDSGDKSAPGGSVAFTLDASSIAGATGTFPGGASCTLAPAGPDSSSCSVNYRPATTEGSHVIKGAYGGSALHDTSSGTDSINVTKRSTTTSVACPASLALHETGSCTATVTDSDSGDKSAPGGSVAFTLDASSIAGATGTFPGGASCTLAPAGPDSSSCSVNYRPATTEGSHVIKGAYGGSALHDTSSGTDSINVTKRSTTTSVACPASLALHETGSCTATVTDSDSGDKSAPGGSVAFTLDASSIAGATGTFPGGASCTLAPAGPDSSSCSVNYRPATTEGSHVIKGAYGGSALHDTSSGTDSINVTKRSTTTSVACPASLALHETGSCTATVTDSDSGDKSAPGGSVAFTLDASSIAGATGTFPGGASCTLAPAGPDSSSCSVNYRPATTEGSHVIKGAYGGSALHDTSSGTDSINVTKRSTTTSVACPASLALHETGSCTATVTDSDSGDKSAPGGSVAFTLDASSIAGATGTFPGGASCTLAPAGPDSSSCSVNYRPATTEGSHVIKGAYGGSALHDTSSGTDSINVTKRSTTTSVACPASLALHETGSCTATVTDSDSGDKSAPGGSVAFTLDASSIAGATGTFPGGASCTLAPAGPDSSSCSVNYRPATTEGSHVIKGAYGGSALHDTSSGTDSINVTKRSTTTSVACPASLALHETGSCTATVTDSDSGDKSAPGGSVAFTLDASSIAGATGTFPGGASCTLAPAGPDSSSCSVNYRPATTEGSHVIKGAYGGSALHDTSSGTDSINVTKRDTSTSVSCAPTSVVVSQNTTCTATVTDTDAGDTSAPSGNVTFSSSGPGTFSAGTGTFTAPSTCALAPAGPSSSTCSVTYTPSGSPARVHTSSPAAMADRLCTRRALAAPASPWTSARPRPQSAARP